MIDHIAIIPDGNRRWARANGKAPEQGHLEGFERTREIIEKAFIGRVRNLTFWGASLDNLVKRPEDEVNHLYGGFQKHLQNLLTYKEIHKQGIRVNILGRWQELFPESLQKVIQTAIDTTQGYSNYTLNFLLGYNGDEEMLRAIQSISEQKLQNPDLIVTPELIKQSLYTKDLPPVDLLIRTGGEPHNSVGFMMWDTANSQYYFTDTNYPDFGMTEFDAAIAEYKTRGQRRGK
jgi:undecaprenyl diphosphate synthase